MFYVVADRDSALDIFETEDEAKEFLLEPGIECNIHDFSVYKAVHPTAVSAVWLGVITDNEGYFAIINENKDKVKSDTLYHVPVVPLKVELKVEFFNL